MTSIFDIDDEDDDDDEIILISSTRQRYENLHGINRNNNLNNYKINNNNDNGNNDDDDEDDEIIVVKVRPPMSRRKGDDDDDDGGRLYQRAQTFFQFGRIISGDIIEYPSSQLLTLLLIVLPIIMIQRKKRFCVVRQRRSRTITDTTKVLTVGTEVTTKATTAGTEMEITANIGHNNNSPNASIENENEIGDISNVKGEEEEEEKKAGKAKIAIDGVITQTQTWQSHQIIAQQGTSSSSLLSSSSSSTSNILTNEQRDNSSQAQKLQMARQIAKDIRLVQDVLIEHSLDPSMAPQLAISLQSSQHIVESQRDICYQQAMLDAHQRQLDRQQSCLLYTSPSPRDSR